MTTLYKPVLIETAEQAEALPTGTIAEQNGWLALQSQVNGWRLIWPPGRTPKVLGIIGWTALVPIEAEEERQGIAECEIGAPGSERITHQRRYVTPWEEA